jgi:hypothetical protein
MFLHKIRYKRELRFDSSSALPHDLWHINCILTTISATRREERASVDGPGKGGDKIEEDKV